MIRLMNENDIDDVSELLRQVNLVHHLIRPDIFKKNNKYNKEELKKLIDNKDYHIFVYYDKKVIGHAFCIDKIIKGDNLLMDIKTLYIDDICVDENNRGKGIASKLYDYVKSYAKENGYYNIELNVWEHNDSAKAFYENKGLKPLKVTMEDIL